MGAFIIIILIWMFLPLVIGLAAWAHFLAPRRGWRTVSRLDLAGLMLVTGAMGFAFAFVRSLNSGDVASRGLDVLYLLMLPFVLPLAWLVRYALEDSGRKSRSLHHRDSEVRFDFLKGRVRGDGPPGDDV